MRQSARSVCVAAGAIVVCCAPEAQADCRSRFESPSPRKRAVDLNGVRLPDVCINGTGSTGAFEIFVIGDWGGLIEPGHKAVRAADHRKDGVHKRDFVKGLDDLAQHKVADVMEQRALWVDPDYVINVGDNFYWSGVDQECCTSHDYNNFSSQWQDIFEAMYAGDGLSGKQWLGVLGNHDYGGFLFTSGWDQAIKYTWVESESGPGRWMTPAQFWRSRVRYPDFSVDYFFLDSNVFDAKDPFEDVQHNICSIAHNKINATCSLEGGPESTTDCPKWFRQLWDAQSEWLEWQLSSSDADWQIVVTHFPPSFGTPFWKRMASTYGIDLIITGHLHRQEIHVSKKENILAPTAWIVSGGGGGVTSDWMPSLEGDDSYGFMHLTLSKETITIRNVNHRNQDTRVEVVKQRHCEDCFNATRAEQNLIGEPWHPSGIHNSTAKDESDDMLFTEYGMTVESIPAIPSRNFSHKPPVPSHKPPARSHKSPMHHNSSNASLIPLVHHVPPGANSSCTYDGEGCCTSSKCFEGVCNLTCCGFKSKESCLAHGDLLKGVADLIGWANLKRALAWFGFAIFVVSVGLLVLWKYKSKRTSRAEDVCPCVDNRQMLISAASRAPSLDSDPRQHDVEQGPSQGQPQGLAVDNELLCKSRETFDESVGNSEMRLVLCSNRRQWKEWSSTARLTSRHAQPETSPAPSPDRAQRSRRTPCARNSQQAAAAPEQLLALPDAHSAAPTTGQLLALPDAHSAAPAPGQAIALPDAHSASPATGHVIALPNADSAALATGQVSALRDTDLSAPATGQVLALPDAQWAAVVMGQVIALPDAQSVAPATGQLLALPDAPSTAHATGQLLALPDAHSAASATGQVVAVPDAHSLAPASGQAIALPDARVAVF